MLIIVDITTLVKGLNIYFIVLSGTLALISSTVKPKAREDDVIDLEYARLKCNT